MRSLTLPLEGLSFFACQEEILPFVERQCCNHKNLLAREERKDTDTNEHQIHDTR